MSDWQKFRDKILDEDLETRREYERLESLYTAISDVIRLRLEKGLTQEELARKMGKQQPAIARLEGGRVRPSIAFLQDVAEALDAKLVLRIEEKTDEERRAS